MRLFNRNKSRLDVRFCERCGSVCDRACRANAARDQARLSMLSTGWRLA